MSDIKSYYPNALIGKEYASECVKSLKKEHGFDFKKTILATSVCSDEIIETATNFREFLPIEEPFNLGGLAGFPFTGITGFNAFAGHIPDDGCAIIFYGPHIGITEKGHAGMVLRSGQESDTSSCGALKGVVNHLLADEGTKPDKEFDYQQRSLTDLLGELSEEIETFDEPILETTELMYKQISSRIHQLFEKTKDQFIGKKVALVGGIIINTDYGLPDMFEEREVKVHAI